MKYDFDSCIDRTKVMSIKWSSKLRQEMYGESDVIPLGIADMDFKAAPAVAKAIQDRAAHENYGYGYLADEFLMACVNWQKRRNHWDIKKEWITYTPGLNLPLVFAIELFTDPGDNVIIQSPVYYPYYDYVNKTGRHIVYNALVNKDGYYEMNFEQLEMQAKDPKTKLILVCSPQNPSGRLWTKEELTRIHLGDSQTAATAAVSTADTEAKLDWKQQKEEQARLRKIQNDLKKTETEIERLESREAEIDELMTQESVFTNVAECIKLNKEKEEIAEQLLSLMEQWEELSEQAAQ